MKKVIFVAILGTVCISAFAQGQLNFANFGGGANAPVYYWDGTKLAGSRWSADLFWAPGVVADPSALQELGAPATFASSGYFLGGPRTIPGQLGGSLITAQVRVWETSFGATWTLAVQNGGWSGESILFPVSLTAPPQNPNSLTGLNGHPFVVGALTPYSTFSFANYSLGAVNAPVTDGYGHAINGPGFVADLYWARGTVTDSTVLAALQQPAPFSTNGYFFGGERRILVAPFETTVTVQVRVWDLASGGSWNEASASSHPGFLAASPLFQVTPGFNSPLMGLQPFASGICQTCPSVIPAGFPFTVGSSGSNYLLLSWPWFHPYAAESEFRQYVALQQNPDLNPTNWLTLPNNPWLVAQTNGVQYQLLIPAPSGTMFYRLRWQ